MPLDATPTRPRAATEAAIDLLERSLRHDRWDMSAQDYADQAVPLLRAAGFGELADQIEDDPWGGDTALVLSELRRLTPITPRSPSAD